MCHCHDQGEPLAREPRRTWARPLRASDADRERVAEVLRRSAGEGRLDAEELERRLEAAYGATYVHEADAQLHDLPAPEPHPVAWRATGATGVPVFVVALALIAILAASTGMWWLWLLAWPAARMLQPAGHDRRPPVRGH
jgi:hypothetical protein